METIEGLPSIEELHDELLGYANVILGRADPPLELDGFYLDLMEVAAVYYARAKEIDMLIHWEEQNRRVIRGSPYYKFRTGQLRSFIEMAKMMADLGSSTTDTGETADRAALRRRERRGVRRS